MARSFAAVHFAQEFVALKDFPSLLIKLGHAVMPTSPKLLGLVSLRAAITFANISSDPARAAAQLVVPGR